MHPEQIKAAIRMTGTTPAQIADDLQLCRTTVSQVINGRGTSKRVMARIAEITSLPVETLWPPKPASVLRRPKVACDQFGFPLNAVPIGTPYQGGKRRAGAAA